MAPILGDLRHRTEGTLQHSGESARRKLRISG
jgi:hypothetical protein